MLDFWEWLIGEERPNCVPQAARRVSLLNRPSCPIRDSRGGCWSFREWLTLRYPLFEARGFGGSWSGVELQAFIDSQDRSFKEFLRKLLDAKKIIDPQLVQEAETLIADHSNSIFDYGEELLRIAAAGRGRLSGADVLQAATEAAGRLWEKLWRLESYAGTQTWESRFPQSARRGGIRGTVRGFANYLIGHFAQRLRKSRGGTSTFQRSQIEAPIDPEARVTNPEGEWEEWKAAIIGELVKDLHDEMAREGGKHWQSRIRNLRWAIAVADELMKIPYQRRSMAEVMEEIPELRGVARGGLQQTLKALIDDARNRAVAKMGSAREQGVAHWLQKRSHRSLGQTEGRILPSLWACGQFGSPVRIKAAQ
jgi:hypothetical protein